MSEVILSDRRNTFARWSEDELHLWSAGLDSWTLLISVVGGRCRPKLVRQRCQWLLDGFRFLGEREVPRGGWLILRHPSRDSCPEP